MKKIPTLFVRDETDRRYVTDVVTPGCEWVLAGEGIPTRKWDGTCVRIIHTVYDGVPLVGADVRREVKPGKTPPPHFQAVEHDETTGKTVGWEPYGQSGFAKYIDEAFGSDEPSTRAFPEGTYELVGPKINGNPDRVPVHALLPHGKRRIMDLHGRSFDAIRDWALAHSCEGLVFWERPGDPTGRMVKIKGRDFRSGSSLGKPE